MRDSSKASDSDYVIGHTVHVSLYVAGERLPRRLREDTQMGRPGITAVDVVRAYVALLKQRRRPGPQNLRLELRRGSFTTIARHVERLALKHKDHHPPRRDGRGGKPECESVALTRRVD